MGCRMHEGVVGGVGSVTESRRGVGWGGAWKLSGSRSAAV